VHQVIVSAKPPKGSCAQLVGCIGWTILHDAVTGLDVVQEEVAVGVDDLVSERKMSRNTWGEVKALLDT
jgi:hypothetical protein